MQGGEGTKRSFAGLWVCHGCWEASFILLRKLWLSGFEIHPLNCKSSTMFAPLPTSTKEPERGFPQRKPKCFVSSFFFFNWVTSCVPDFMLVGRTTGNLHFPPSVFMVPIRGRSRAPPHRTAPPGVPFGFGLPAPKNRGATHKTNTYIFSGGSTFDTCLFRAWGPVSDSFGVRLCFFVLTWADPQNGYPIPRS